MCARFGNTLTGEQLSLYFSLPGPGPQVTHRPDIRPTNQIPLILAQDGPRAVAEARWWLVPSWWKKELKDLPPMFNARAETVAEKPSFRSAFKSRRCLIPATCFYEWTGDKGSKQKHRIARVTGVPLIVQAPAQGGVLDHQVGDWRRRGRSRRGTVAYATMR